MNAYYYVTDVFGVESDFALNGSLTLFQSALRRAQGDSGRSCLVAGSTQGRLSMIAMGVATEAMASPRPRCLDRRAARSAGVIIWGLLMSNLILRRMSVPRHKEPELDSPSSWKKKSSRNERLLRESKDYI